jgi:hypothetical protein
MQTCFLGSDEDWTSSLIALLLVAMQMHFILRDPCKITFLGGFDRHRIDESNCANQTAITSCEAKCAAHGLPIWRWSFIWFLNLCGPRGFINRL